MTHNELVDKLELHTASSNCNFFLECKNGMDCRNCIEKDITDYENNLLQNFAQWLWDNKYLTNEAFTIRLVDEYRGKRGTK